MSDTFDRVFVVTYGRSGSTLLQGLLNAIPGYRVYGENGAFLFKLQDSYEALLYARRHVANPIHDNETHAWFGSSRYIEKSIILKFRRFVDHILFETHLNKDFSVFGFKEIRFDKLTDEQMGSYLNFVRTLYPNAAIVFNTRNIEDVLKSGWWRKNERSRESTSLSKFFDYCDNFSKEHPDYSIHVSYDELILRDRKEVSRLLDFLGASVDGDEIERVFQGNHSSQNRTITSYLAGRVDHITIERPDWWRTNIDEFRIEITSSPAGYVVAGHFLPAIGSTARLFLESGDRRTEFVGTRPTPRIEALFSANPAASHAGFKIEAKSSDLMYLFGESEEGAEAVVAVVNPGRAISARGSQRGIEPGEEGAGKR